MRLAGIAHGGARCTDPGTDRGFGYDTAAPHCVDQIFPRNDLSGRAQQAQKQVEYLWLDVNILPVPGQSVPISVEAAVLKMIAHGTILLKNSLTLLDFFATGKKSRKRQRFLKAVFKRFHAKRGVLLEDNRETSHDPP
nr:hypothetical protein [Thalassovita aquimarina]